MRWASLTPGEEESLHVMEEASREPVDFRVTMADEGSVR